MSWRSRGDGGQVVGFGSGGSQLRGRRRAAQSELDARFVAILLACGCIAAISGWAIASGKFQLLVLVPLVLAVAGFSMIERAPVALVLSWLALGPILVPFARFPSGSGALITFDRVVLLGLAVTMFATLVDLSRASRQTLWFVGSLAAISALVLFRALLGTVGDTQGLKVFLDAFLLPTVAFAVVRATATSQRRVDAMLLAVGIGGAIVGLTSAAERALGFTLAPFSGGIERFDLEADIVRYSGPYSVPEVCTVVALCSLAATLCWLRRSRGRWVPASLMVVLQLAAIYLSFFRTGWAVALLIIVGSFLWGKENNQRAVVGALVAIGLAVIAVGQLSQGQSAVSTRLNNSANSYARIAAYQQGLQMIRANPVLGVGLGGYPTVSRTMAPTWFGGRHNVNYPHNSLIQIAAEAGLLALLAIIALGFSSVRLVIGLWRRTTGWLDDRLAVCGALTLAAYFLYGLPFSLLPYGASTAAVFTILALCSARLDHLALAVQGRPDEPEESDDRSDSGS